MRKLSVALLLLVGTAAALAGTAFARSEDLGDDATPKLTNAQMIREMRSAVARGGVSTLSTGDTAYVGFVPGKKSGTNYWSIGIGNNVGYPKLGGGPGLVNNDYGVWNWDSDTQWGGTHDNITYLYGDSLMGWWPYRFVYTSTGGKVLPDDQRPWWAIDHGNTVNYAINGSMKRSIGVIGVWHKDTGSSAGGGVTWNTSDWGGSAGGHALWCGLRRAGDTAVLDDPTRGGTGNAFNSNALINGVNGGSTGGGIGTSQKFPGYGSQWDQMAYKDIDVTGKSTVQLRFKIRTNMSTAFGTNTSTRTGWFDKDPLLVTAGNFISSSAAGTNAPRDSFMVYVGAGVGYAAGSSFQGSDGNSHTVFDAQRRWFSEVIKIDQPYHNVFSIAGDNAATKDWGNGDALGVARTLVANVDASWNNKARIVFRNKTNRGFDDQGGSVIAAYSSNGAGAVVLDDIEVNTGSGFSSLIDFETSGDVDNSTSVDPINAMKTTGKPPGVYHHVHSLSSLTYQDLCGKPGNTSRICNMDGQVISMGDHDRGEAEGGVFGTPEQELFEGIMSPTVQFVNGNVMNSMDMTPSTAEVTDDYYIQFDIYTGEFDLFNDGDGYQFGWMTYPGTQSDGVKTWGDWRIAGFQEFNPDKQCYTEQEACKGNALLKYNTAVAADKAFGAYPDSIRFMLRRIQQCYRFGVTAACSGTGGDYWDNVSLVLTDGTPQVIGIDIWQLINDTFPANRNVTLPGVAAKFDTTSALVKIGLNIAQTNGNIDRYVVPGDTMTVNSEGSAVDMYLVFRVNPGPGNYSTIGTKTSSLRLVPTSATACNIDAPQASPANFWEQYLLSNGSRGTPGGHPAAAGINGGAGGKRWSNLVWNSARIDTAELNIFPIILRGIGGPFNGTWSSMYIEQDPKFTILGLDKNRCFLKHANDAVTQANITCDVTQTDGWETTSGYTTENGLAHGHTYEYTKVFPDGQFTPGTHVEYFFERIDETGSGGVCETTPCLAPDTTTVFPQNAEGSFDAHRWQEFSVVPDRWKDLNYSGINKACMLYVDMNDRRGDERVWVSVADSTGATAVAKYGAHNGWHAPGTGNNAVNATSSFVYNLNECPGTTWDMFGEKASESLNSRAGSIGADYSNHTASLVDNKWSTLGPTLTMLSAYYKVLLLLSGDLNSVILGTELDYGADDTQILQDFLQGAATGNHRGIFVEGDGFMQANDAEGAGSEQLNLMTAWFKVSLRDPNYIALTKVSNQCLDLVPSAPISTTDVYGIQSVCLYTLDVLQPEFGGAQASKYSPSGTASPAPVSGVFHDAVDGSEPYQTLLDGFDIRYLRSRYCDGPRGRQFYYYNVLNNIFGKICAITGSGGGVNDVPSGGAQEFVDFMNLRNNPLVSGQATVELGISKADRVEVKVFDVSGRLVRTLADRQFAPGKYTLTWDGSDNGGRQVARGVYFTQVKYVNRKFTDARKLTVLK